MISKLGTVMGLQQDLDDPDTSYVLTVDNLIKMLAIQMRFRCFNCRVAHTHIPEFSQKRKIHHP